MKITVITGSPHRNGTSALLADEFIRGAEENGHVVWRFDSAFEDVHPCIACCCCDHLGNVSCVIRDSMDKLYPHMMDADVIALATPVYYWSISAQLKATIDRWEPIVLAMRGKRVALMTTQYNSEEWVLEPLWSWYHNLCRYLEWQDAGQVSALACDTRAQIEASDYPRQAYELGKSL